MFRIHFSQIASARLKKGFGRVVLALDSVEARQVMEGLGHVWVLRVQRLFPDRQRPFVERLGVGIATTCLQVQAS